MCSIYFTVIPFQNILNDWTSSYIVNPHLITIRWKHGIKEECSLWLLHNLPLSSSLITCTCLAAGLTILMELSSALEFTEFV